VPTIKKTKIEYEGRIIEREVIVEEQRVQPWGPEAELQHVGRAAPRVDGAARVTGQAVYTQDVQLPGMLVGRFLRSPHPHARIIAIDSSEAEALPGVWLIWHRRQLPPIDRLNEREIFAEELPYQGAEVAFVVAQDAATAAEALHRIVVSYEELPFAHSLDAAIAEDAPPVFAGQPHNLAEAKPDRYERGSMQQGLDTADVLVELTFTTQTAAHCCLETHGCVARWEGDELTVWHSTQDVFGTRNSIAKALGLPQDRVRAICAYMGGGFGSKWGAEPYMLMAALAARETGRPIQALLDRNEEHLVAGFRPSSRQKVRLGARQDGTLTLIEHEAWVTTGAFGGTMSIIVGPSRDLYACPNVSTRVWGVRINTDPARAFRAPGYVEGTFALEATMDALAAELGIDPLELRLKNYAETSPARGVPYTQKGLRQAYEAGAERFGWNKRLQKARQTGPWRRGQGIASQIWGGGGGPPANAIVKLLPDATAEVLVGSQDIGTGTRTVLAQVAAEELGIPLEAVHVVVGDTLATPFGPGSGGSVTLASTTPAVREAAHAAKEQLLELAAALLELPQATPVEFVVQHGTIIYQPDPQKRLSYQEVSAKMGNYTIVGRGARGPNPETKAVNTFGAHFAEVEVNLATGQVRLLRLVAAHDIGRVVNPMTATSQVYGGATMGLGFGIMEERVIDARTGLQLTANLEDYRVPTMMDLPKFDVVFVGQADPEANSVGAKGLGEPPIVPAPAAIANAIADAIGVRLTDLPITPDRILRALRSKGEGSSWS
jgi:xanthine dehydrogenase YagR molybdenum-binding subunit